MAVATRSLRDLPELDVFSDAFSRDPHAALTAALARGPLARSARGLEALSYGACQDVYRDPNLGVGQREAFDACGIADERFIRTFLGNINNVEGEAHRRLRRVVTPFFTPARAERLRVETRALIDAWLDDVGDAGECDLMDAMARRLPASVFCRTIGAPLADAERVARLSRSLTLFFLRDPAHRDEILAAFDEISAYAGDLLERRAREPADDFLSGLVEAEAGGEIDRDGSVAMIVTFMTASTDTTSGQLGLALIALDEHPEQWALLRREEQHVPAAVIELARFAPGVWATARTARAEGEFMGVRLEPGTGVFSNVLSANRDPDVYESPYRLDVTRSGVRPPLTWGIGHHFCVGRALAVMELEEAFGSMLERWSEFELAGDPELVGKPFLVSPSRLPIRFDATGRRRAGRRGSP
jgi:cytochrome P450